MLLVDATQGVQAQTVANSLLAINGGLEIIPVLNKIHLRDGPPPDECVEEIENVLGLDGTDALRISGKTARTSRLSSRGSSRKQLFLRPRATPTRRRRSGPS